MSKNDTPATDPNPAEIHNAFSAYALGIVSIAIALMIVLWAFHGYDPKATVCEALSASGGSIAAPPRACQFPALPLIGAGLIAIAGLGAAVKVWKE